MADRRNPSTQRPNEHGRRASDPTLDTTDCARRLGVSTDFIVGEIRDGRLLAIVIERPGRRAIYRVSEEAFAAYIVRYRWKQPNQSNRQSR